MLAARVELLAGDVLSEISLFFAWRK